MSDLSLVIHGAPGVGKSWLADSAPAPRLVLDVEGGARFTPSPKVEWDTRLTPPATRGSSLVRASSHEEIDRAGRWLASGRHFFKSIVVDSLTELQRRLHVDDEELWSLILAFRELPLECVVFVCETRSGAPQLEGPLRDALPYAVDVVAHVTASGGERRAQFQPTADVVAKDRTGRLGAWMTDPTLPKMLARVADLARESA